MATLAILAQVPTAKRAMDATADSTIGNLVSGSTYLHGVSMADFAVTCGNLPGVTMWAPVQSECDLGTLANNIDQTLFLDEVYVNSLEFSYTTGANATENYGAETDNKMWLLNAGAFVSWESLTVTSGTTEMTVASGVTIPMLSTGNYAFLKKDTDGVPGIAVYDDSEDEKVVEPLVEITDLAYDATADYGYDATEFVGAGPYTITFPTGVTAPTAGDKIEVVYAANGYSGGNTYFEWKPASDNDEVGAVRQGQIEIYIMDPDSSAVDFDNAWRLTGVTISADLTREPLTELGHLGPYDRPLTLPIPITVTVDSTAGDLETWAKFAAQLDDYETGTLDDIDLNDLMGKDNLILVAKIFEQTDEEAGGTADKRKVIIDDVVGEQQFMDGTLQTAYNVGDREYAMKTVVVKNLKITDEGMTLDVGSNATQTYGFRCNNDLFVVKGDLSYSMVADVMRNST